MSVSVFLRHNFSDFSLDIRFSVEATGITALFGKSGAGKSTIVNAIAGLLQPHEGCIVIGGQTVLDTAANVCVAPGLRHTGYVFQDARLFPHMNVENNLLFGWRRATQKATQHEINHVIDLLDLHSLLGRRPVKLSGGERGRVALGRALLSSPRLLLLDEPLAALDAARKAEILPYLERLRDEKKIPMLYVSHALDEVTRLADNLVIVDKGQVTAQGTVFDLMGDVAFARGAGLQAYGAVLPAHVSGHQDDGLTRLEFSGGALFLARLDCKPGTALRVRIRAEDVMLAREEPRAISANNILSARIQTVAHADATHSDVQLICGTDKLVARITRASLTRLQLVPGMDIFAIVKSVTVDPQTGTDLT